MFKRRPENFLNVLRTLNLRRLYLRWFVVKHCVHYEDITLVDMKNVQVVSVYAQPN